MSDEKTTLADLKAAMQAFVDERDWSQFHNPKNLSMALAIEAAELMEHFQWLTPESAAAVRESPEQMQQVREELADVLCFALSFANALQIDIATAVREKMVKNAAKYPAEKFRGRFR
jgi:dCTP diphosphatase